MTAIVFIMGAGRSGTTLLDIILGNAANTVSCGELNRIPVRNGIAPGRPPDDSAYRVWEQVLSFVEEEGFDFGEMEVLFRDYEYHAGCFQGLFRTRWSGRYGRFNMRVYESLSSLYPGKILIDSSKYPGRAWALAQVLPRDRFGLGYIFLKRDPVQVVRAFQKKDVEQPERTYIAANAYYLVVNVLCGLTAHRLRFAGYPVVELSYDELLLPTSSTWRKIASLGIDTKEISGKFESNSPFSTGPLFDGNRIRLLREITVRSNGPQSFGVRDWITRLFNWPVFRSK